MDSLQKLPTGTGWVFSPYFLETLERIQFRKKKTFDSSATPRPGQRRRVPKTVADVDLGVLQERMAATIERARSEDPKELRRHIARLRKEIAGRPTEAVIETRVEHVEVPVFKDSEVKRLESAIDKLSDVGSELVAVAKEIGSALTSVQRIATGPSTAAAEQPRESRPRQSAHLGAAPHRGGSTTKAGQRVPVARPAPVPRADDVQIKAGARRILEALARYPSGELTRSQIGVMAKFKITGGTFQTYMSVLKRAGLN